jgi:HEAT repeat protein
VPKSIEELVQRLAVAQGRNAAQQALIQLGSSAVAPLLEAAGRSHDVSEQKAILRTLVAIADPRAADLFRRSLKSGDPDIRALAGHGLYCVKATDAINALQLTINDAPDPLHFLQTPSLQALVEIGRPALATIFTLMESSDALTRQRAQHGLAGIVLNEITRMQKPRPLTSDAQSAWQRICEQNGSYDWNADAKQRAASIALWREWYLQMESARPR